MKLPLAYYGDVVLRKKAAAITVINDFHRKLIEDMFETMEVHNGCGLAAPQVHQSIALFITRIPQQVNENTILPGELRIFINPKILSYNSQLWECKEGCLSIPGIEGVVARPTSIIVQATDLDGQIFEEEFIDLDARVMMHENDHLNGVLYIDRMVPKKKKEIESYLKEVKKKYNQKKS